MAGTVNPINFAAFPGQARIGQKVIPEPTIFVQPVVMQGGMATQVNGATLPVITAPGTVASLGTVTNTTGFDAMVYMSASTGISKVVYVGVAAGTIGTPVPSMAM